MTADDYRIRSCLREERPWQIDERCDRYEEEWRALRAPRIEDYLDGIEGEARHRALARAGDARPGAAAGRGEEPTLADYRGELSRPRDPAGCFHGRAGPDRGPSVPARVAGRR